MTTKLNKPPPQHTPGPWIYDKETGEVFTDEKYVQPRVAQVDLDNVTDIEQGHADGCLIAAAPDLLEALEVAYAELENHKGVPGVAVLPCIEAAIAKARGQP